MGQRSTSMTQTGPGALGTLPLLRPSARGRSRQTNLHSEHDLSRYSRSLKRPVAQEGLMDGPIAVDGGNEPLHIPLSSPVSTCHGYSVREACPERQRCRRASTPHR